MHIVPFDAIFDPFLKYNVRSQRTVVVKLKVLGKHTRGLYFLDCVMTFRRYHPFCFTFPRQVSELASECKLIQEAKQTLYQQQLGYFAFLTFNMGLAETFAARGSRHTL